MTGATTVEGPWQIAATLAVTPVSRTWRVTLGEQPAVLRVDEPGARWLGLNRNAEPAVLRTVAAVGLGPACISADPGRGVLLTEWLPGSAWSAAELRQPDNLRQAAGLLRRVHGVALRWPVVDLAAAIDRYGERAGAGGARLAQAARAQLQLALDPHSGLPAPAPCLCHNDPSPGNFIASPGGGLKLVDWEYAGVGHPGFDLAGLAVGANLAAAEAEFLLEAYLGRPPQPADICRHRAWETFCHSLSALWVQALLPLVQGFEAES